MVSRLRSIALIIHRLTVFAINLKSAGRKAVGVQVPLRAPKNQLLTLSDSFFEKLSNKWQVARSKEVKMCIPLIEFFR